MGSHWKMRRGKLVFSMLLFATCSTVSCLAASMPSELRGEYTFGTSEQCGYLSVTAAGFSTNEDLGCTASKIQRSSGSPGERSSFQAEFVCQVDDPKKVIITGLLEFSKLRETWVLAMHLTVNPKDRQRVSVPTLQIYAKCGGQ
jgi:hypothetical protein